MPITSVDAKCALVVIDLQKSILSRQLTTPIGPIVERTNALGEAFRRRGFPVVFVTAGEVRFGRTDVVRPKTSPSPDAADLLPGLKVAASDYRPVKTTIGAFTSTDLEIYLRDRGVTQAVVTGVATSFGVESTVRHAAELGFNVTVVIDAVTDVSAENHDRALAGIFPRMAETCITAELIELLG